MPSPNATRFELAVYVEPEHVAKFKELTELPDSGNVLLACEHTIGQLLGSANPSYTAGVMMRNGNADYGADVAEISLEDES